MALTDAQCHQFSSYLFRRTPNFMKHLVDDMFPRDYVYTTLYENLAWDSFTGTAHTWDRMHVAMPQDAGDWEQVDAGACAIQICDPQSRSIDWGSDRAVFNKFRRRWKTRILCLDQLRHVEEAVGQLESIWKGLMKVPEYVQADWMKYQMALGADKLYMCGGNGITVTPTPTTFTGGLNIVNLGLATNLPTSKLQMPYLMAQVPPLQYNGYFDGEFVPTGMFKIITDIQTAFELANGNPALTQMFSAADFEKGGKYYKYGAMMGVGNFLIQIHPFPPRFYDTGSGKLQRVWPFTNQAATIGLKPVVDPQYENAPIQISTIPHRKARIIYTGEVTPVHPRMNFGSRDLWGKWNWINDAYLEAFDPNSGTVCKMDNPVRNKGYFLADFEAGVQNVRPELERVIFHLREPQGVVDMPVTKVQGQWNAALIASTPTAYQNLLPYNVFCDPQGEEA